MIDTETLFYKFKIYTEFGENASVHLPLSVALGCSDAIKEQDAKISQLEKEADWLAEQVSRRVERCSANAPDKWREAARKEVEDAVSNTD